MSPQDSPQRPWSARATAPGPGALHSPPREPTLAPPGSRHRPVISSQAESRQAGLRPAELARATETCVHATACTGHLGCVGPWAGGILQTEMRQGCPSHTRSVVRAPLAVLLVPSFRTWIPVARAPCFRLLSACAPLSSQQELKAHLSLCSGPSTGFPSRAEQTAELSWGVRGSTCSGPRDRSAVSAAPPESLRPRPWPHSVCLARTSLRALALCLRPGHSPRNPCGALSRPLPPLASRS